tara:strand:- start:35 stop:514 length:480 start_codon:yes stop_codon:yes gene_type:complete
MTWLEKIQTRLKYDPTTGIVTNRNGRNKGNKPDTYGYINIKLNERQFKAHTIATVIMTGAFPKGEIDHKDRIRHNNVWSNLRDVDTSTNQLNKPIQKNNTSGHKGVSFRENRNKWNAQFERIVNGRRVLWNKSFKTLEEAVNARAAELARIGAKPSMRA